LSSKTLARMSTDTSKSLFDQAMKEILATNYVAAELYLQQASEINEEHTTLYAASLAILLALRNRETEAIELLEERLEEFSTDSNLLLAYGITLEKQKKFVDAEDAFRESLESDPECPGALRGLSACLERKGDLVGGCRLAAKAFSLQPENMILAKNAAKLLEQAGQLNTAAEILELGAHYNPEDEELVVKALDSCLKRGAPERAWEILILVDETQGWAAAWKASFLDWQGDFDRANDIIQTTLQRPAGSDLSFLFHLCCILMRRGEVAAAETYIDHILSVDPQHPGALRMRADFAMGRFDYNPAIDPVACAILASEDAPSWARFWSFINTDEIQSAEETLGLMAEDEAFLSDPGEVARLEIAEQFFLVISTGESAESELHALNELPAEAACGVLLEFLEVIESKFADDEGLAAFRQLLNRELRNRDPVLHLTRLYALERWERLESALAEFDQNVPLDADEDQVIYREIISQLYGLLHALGTEQDDAVDEFDFEEDPVLANNVLDVLNQKVEKNPVEQRFIHKIKGELEKVTVREIAAPVKLDDSPNLYEVGGVLDHRDMAVVVYETEDGELVEDFNAEDYEIIEEVEEDEEDGDYEYVWVEEEVEEEFVPEEPSDSF
jgi:tetratricopeptide (TPR) repeat protein